MERPLESTTWKEGRRCGNGGAAALGLAHLTTTFAWWASGFAWSVASLRVGLDLHGTWAVLVFACVDLCYAFFGGTF